MASTGVDKMGVASIIVIVLNLLGAGAIAWFLWSQRGSLHAWVSESVSSEIRRQDDRIRKAVRKEDGMDSETPRTDSEQQLLEATPRAGQPYRGS